MHDGKEMMPKTGAGMDRYRQLAQLERELFSWWCTLLFRPSGLMGGMFSPDGMSGAMKGFLECIGKVDKELSSTKGPWFFDEYDYPTMIDFIYISHVERMLASCAYWQGLNLRDVKKWGFTGLNNWLDAFDKRETYLAFKSDYYTNVKDIPPQYGPGYDGGFEKDRKAFSKNIVGEDGSWNLPLAHDDALQPLYRGLPLPVCVLEAMNLEPDAEGSYESCDPVVMAKACREMAAWKLASNGVNVSQHMNCACID
jgi:glutathione S-transferase